MLESKNRKVLLVGLTAERFEGTKTLGLVMRSKTSKHNPEKLESAFFGYRDLVRYDKKLHRGHEGEDFKILAEFETCEPKATMGFKNPYISQVFYKGDSCGFMHVTKSRGQPRKYHFISHFGQERDGSLCQITSHFHSEIDMFLALAKCLKGKNQRKIAAPFQYAGYRWIYPDMAHHSPFKPK